MRALIVTNLHPSPAHPALGPFVRDQVAALRRRHDVDVELFTFPPGLTGYPAAARALRRQYAGETFDVVHAHFGLCAWPALLARLGPVVVTLHGNDLLHPRSRRITLAALPFVALPTAVSRELAQRVPGAGTTRRVGILPVGIDLERFRPIARGEARRRLGLDPAGPFLLFPHAPGRPLKRRERAEALAAATGAQLLGLGGIPPEDVPLWINAANAVLVPSEAEGFGLAVIEALACEVPVLATPVGIHPVALEAVAGTHCGPWDLDAWHAAVAPHLAADDPRVDGRRRAETFGADRMAARVVAAWREVVAARR